MVELTNKQLVEQLQELGVEDINPNATKIQLQAMLDEATKNANAPESKHPVKAPEGASDMEKIMAAISGLTSTVDTLAKDVDRMKTGGKNDFMNEIKQSDVDKAEESKSKADPRVVAIVEETLGIDFGVEITPNPNSPGFAFTVLVPQRLSPIPSSQRPVIDPATGAYKKDEHDMTVEESYWPGDRRSRAVGSTDSFDLIRDHCNKVRAHIVTYYEKMKKPLPEFKLR
jgi:hypothetical protein